MCLIQRALALQAQPTTVAGAGGEVVGSVKGWTVEDVCTFVQGLRQEFGDQASVYAAAMKGENINGEVLQSLSVECLEELEVSPEHRALLLERIQNLLGTRSTAS